MRYELNLNSQHNFVILRWTRKKQSLICFIYLTGLSTLIASRKFPHLFDLLSISCGINFFVRSLVHLDGFSHLLIKYLNEVFMKNFVFPFSHSEFTLNFVAFKHRRNNSPKTSPNLILYFHITIKRNKIWNIICVANG